MGVAVVFKEMVVEEVWEDEVAAEEVVAVAWVVDSIETMETKHTIVIVQCDF